MQNELTTLKTNLPVVLQVDRRIRRQVIRQMKHMADIAEVTKAGMNEIGEIASYASFEAARSVATMSLWEQAGQLSPEQRQKFANLKTALCQDLERMTHLSSAKIISLIESLPPDAQSSLWDELADFLGG